MTDPEKWGGNVMALIQVERKKLRELVSEKMI
jgi:hypothetical protein